MWGGSGLLRFKNFTNECCNWKGALWLWRSACVNVDRHTKTKIKRDFIIIFTYQRWPIRTIYIVFTYVVHVKGRSTSWCSWTLLMNIAIGLGWRNSFKNWVGLKICGKYIWMWSRLWALHQMRHSNPWTCLGQNMYSWLVSKYMPQCYGWWTTWWALTCIGACNFTVQWRILFCS